MRKWALVVFMAAVAVTASAKDPATLTLPRGARIGVVNLMDAELTHYHTSKVLAQSFMKTIRVGWRVDAMLSEAAGYRFTPLGLVAVPLAPSESLQRNRDEFFVAKSVAKGLSRESAREFAELAATEHLDTLLVLAPSVNNSAQGGDATRRGLPDYLRGWGFISSDGPTRPSLFNMTQLLLVVVKDGSASLQAREWGGAYTEEWADFVPPSDLKQIPAADLDKLQPAFARMLARQVGRALDSVTVSP